MFDYRGLLAAAVSLSALPGWAEVVVVDIGEWPSANETVTASGWTVNGIDLHKEDRGVTFNAFGDYAVSPEYSGFVTQLVVDVCSTQPVLLRNLKAFPESADASARTWTMECTPTAKYVEQSFAWQLSEKVRRFRLQIDGSQGGNWRIRSLTVCLDRIDPPQGLYEDNAYSDALPVGWTSESRAVSYEAEAARVTTVLPCCDLLRAWDFTSLTNTSGNSRGFRELDPPEELDDVGGVTLCLQGYAGGHLQVGNTKTGGTMVLPLPSAKDRVAVMDLFRLEADGNFPVSVEYVDPSGVTNAYAQIRLMTSPTTHALALPDEAASLVLRSEKGDDRIRVEYVKIVTDYVPGSVTTNVEAFARADGNETVIRGLSPGDWMWRVRSFDREGLDSPWSAYRAVTLSADRPPFDRWGCLMIIR